MTIIKNVKLYRPGEGDSPNERHHIIFKDGIIEQITQGDPPADLENVIDGSGFTLAPSFNDSHLHLLRFGLMKDELDLRNVASWKEMQEIIRKKYNQEKMKHGEWMVGRGMMDDTFDDIDRLIDARDLDGLVSEQPMFILHDDGHECIVNTKALNLVKEKIDLTRFPEEFVETDKNGELLGRFKDTAVHLIHVLFRQKSKEKVKEAVASAVPHLLENGITSVHTDDLNYAGSYETLWAAYTELEQEGRLPVDVHLHHYIFNIGDLKGFLENWDMRTGDGTERVKVGAIKIFLDGTQRLHTCALREPYSDRPETRGVLNYPSQDLKDIVKLAAEHDMQVAMHAIGDRAVDEALDAIEFAGEHKLRHRIIHAQVLAPDQFERLEQIKPYLEIQPGFMMKEYKETRKWVGREREKYCNAWGSVDKRKIPFTTSSDCPIGPLSPIIELFAGVNRTDLEGKPEGRWMPDEKVKIDSLYHGYTVTPAELEFQEDRKGKLAPGYFADFVLLSTHPAEISEFEIQDLEVIETWSRGRRAYMQDSKHQNTPQN
ncbi:amidohydrolase [Planococcus lenghuensis]|uniref:Amidohydrolase 3 domain-containing protein n=1 Tax=Planococcus lenghuensis TaxID=2213202 RepID=A0A1Q2KZ72_9BACL|nr:amidohydrolase [Planococcus lenghuensis]AQQ53424.1 hypothetical protein B0X71_10290 [Planococcus lenghuensis]